MEKQFETRAIHVGNQPEETTGAVNVPIYQSSTFVQNAPGDLKEYEYSRTANPTRDALEENLASLENARHGIAFGSGMAAIDTVMKLLNPGDHVIAGQDLYGGSYRLFEQHYRKYDIDFSYVDMTNLDRIEDELRNETRMVWVESPTNPLLELANLESIANLLPDRTKMAVDNTFASPYLQRPLDYGADLVVHSTTKYLGGHSDLVGGAVCTNNVKHGKELHSLQNAAGAVPGPLDCYLTLRGTKTLAVRMERHCENALSLARFLRDQPKVKTVHYPGLASHSQHVLAQKQMDHFGGMISLELTAGVEQTARAISNLEHFHLAESLGGVESLIEHPATMTHGSVPREKRLKAGVTDGLIRLSVGIEHVKDLRLDLEKMLETV